MFDRKKRNNILLSLISYTIQISFHFSSKQTGNNIFVLLKKTGNCMKEKRKKKKKMAEKNESKLRSWFSVSDLESSNFLRRSSGRFYSCNFCGLQTNAFGTFCLTALAKINRRFRLYQTITPDL